MTETWKFMSPENWDTVRGPFPGGKPDGLPAFLGADGSPYARSLALAWATDDGQFHLRGCTWLSDGIGSASDIVARQTVDDARENGSVVLVRGGHGLSTAEAMGQWIRKNNSRTPIRRACSTAHTKLDLMALCRDAEIHSHGREHEVWLARASRTFAHLVRSGRINHDGCPLLRHAIEHFAWLPDFAGEPRFVRSLHESAVLAPAIAAILAINQGLIWIREGVKRGYLAEPLAV